MEFNLTPNEELLFKDCIRYNGIENQIEQYLEECIEGALACRKYFRALKHGTTQEVQQRMAELESEIADTAIMSVQLRQALNTDRIDAEIFRKLTRQQTRIDNKKHND